MADRCLLYYITDRTQFPGVEITEIRVLLAKIAEAARAGVDYIQLREKDLSARALEQLACDASHVIQKLGTENRELRTCLLINSRSDVALAIGADGVHLRSDDVSPEEVRRVWTAGGAGTHQQPVIAMSCHNRGDVDRAQSQGADFAVFAPVFEKKDNPAVSPTGLAALREACQSKIPVLALGGVSLDNVVLCMSAGAAGVAGIRLFQENRVEDVVRALQSL